MKQPAEMEDGVFHQGGQVWSLHISEYEGMCGDKDRAYKENPCEVTGHNPARCTHTLPHIHIINPPAARLQTTHLARHKQYV